MIFRTVDSLVGMKKLAELPEYSRRGGDPFDAKKTHVRTVSAITA